jgi:dihydroorotate dehydrogenase/ferredoxin
MDVDLTTEIAGVVFKNPIAVASGTATRNIYSVRRCVKAGVGAIVTKSIALVHEPDRRRLPRPAIWFFDKYGDPGSGTNIEIANLPAKEGIELVRQIKPITEEEKVVLIANIGLIGDLEAFTEEEALKRIAELAKELEAAGADMLEVQRACPIDVGVRYGGDSTKTSEVKYYIKNILRSLKAEVSIPFFLKVPVEFSFENIKSFEEVGIAAHGICITPSHKGTVIDIETGRPIVPFPLPYHGRGTKAHVNYQVARFAAIAKRPIISSGWTMNSRDVIERLMCGATNVQTITAVLRHGPKVLTEMVDGLKSFMSRKGYTALKDIIGIAMPYVDNPKEYAKFVAERQVPREAMTMTIDKTRCVGCGECGDVCPFGSMSMAAGFPKWSSKLCEFCGACQSACQVDAIIIRRKTSYKERLKGVV